MLISALAVVMLLGSLIAFMCLGWLGGHDRYYDPIPPALVERRSRIEAELLQLQDHPWAGFYVMGFLLGPVLHLHVAPESGATAINHGDIGVWGTREGDIVAAPTGRLDFQFEDLEEHFRIPDNAYPIRWGARRYLIPGEDLMAFVGAINLGDEPRDHFTGRFLLAEGDEDKPVEGLPDLPPGYTQFLRTEWLEVGVVSVESERVERETGCYWEFRLVLDGGLDDGVAAGVRLRRVPPPRFYPDVTVISATPSKAVGIMRSVCGRGSARPDTSMCFTTGAVGRPTRVPLDWDADDPSLIKPDEASGCLQQEE